VSEVVVGGVVTESTVHLVSEVGEIGTARSGGHFVGRLEFDEVIHAEPVSFENNRDGRQKLVHDSWCTNCRRAH
jgi:hypothetical protein